MPPLTKATLVGSFEGGAVDVSGEDMIVIRENSPFMPAGAEPARFGDMATTRSPSGGEREDMGTPVCG